MSTGYNFTERVRRVLAMARDEAARLHHEYVGTEHLLLGLVAEGEGVGATVLQQLNVDLADIRSRVEEEVKSGDASHPVGSELPYTSRAKKVLELSMASARDLEHSYVGTEHLLLGLLREEKGIAAQVLTELGAHYGDVLAETLRLLGTDVPARWSMSSGTGAPRPRSTSIAIEVRRPDGSVTREEFNSVANAMVFLSRQ